MDLGVVYHIETPQQFWAELEDTIGITADTSLAGIDYALRAFVTLCANNHDRFLQTNAQLDHACELLLESELFATHSQRSTDHIVNDAKSNVDPHAQLILYKILLHHGYRQPAFFKNLRKWSQLIPFLMDHIVLEIDDLHGGASSYGGGAMGMGLPIEARLRNLSVVLLYEICRVQKIDAADLKLFTEDFVNRLFDLVEETRNYWDESLNYGLIKLIVSLNEQFMVASLPAASKHSPTSSHSSTRAATRSPAPGGSSAPGTSGRDSPSSPQLSNRVLTVLTRRLGESKTFGENLIFMLNRAENTPEDLCMQLLVLKLLYLLFTTPGTQEYFYTNDLRVLVDVFIRELVDLPDESESLRHTYLRVLHPLVTNTQLKAHPYKRLQIRNVLQSLVAHAHIRDVSQTTKRLVDRCLKAAWCVALDAELEAIKCSQGESRSVDSGVTGKSKSSFVPGEDPKAASTTKTLHKSASMNFGQGSGSGTGGGATGLRRNPSKGAAAAAAGLTLLGSKNPDISASTSAPALPGTDGDRPPRSADAATNSFTNHPPSGKPERKAAGPTVVPLQPPNLESLSISDPSASTDGLPSSDSTHSLPHLQVTRSATINVTAPTPVRENFPKTDASPQNGLDNDIPRPRASSMAEKGKGKGKPLSPPPRPPSSRKPTPSPDVHPPTRNNSLGEVSQTGFNSGERLDLAASKPVEGVRVARRAPPTPPPTKQRRKAPAVPNGGRKGPVAAVGSTMTTIASTNAGNVGLEMPVGRCWMGNPGTGEACEKMVKTAIGLGYRHLDTAAGYRNEEFVGKAIRESGVPRSEFFVTTKLWNGDHGRVGEAFEESLARLGLEYIDLYLMHWPQAQAADGRPLQPDESPTYVETWKAMEKLLEIGKVKSLGVSNFSIKTLDVLLGRATIVPAVNQVQLNPCLPQNELRAYCKSKGIHLTAFSPLGQINSPLHSEDDVTHVAEKYNITSAQVLLSWGVRRGTSVIPKSEREERLKANISVVHIEDEDMVLIDRIHKKPRMHKQLFPSSNVRYVGGKRLTFGWTNEQLGWQLDDQGNWIVD